MDPCPPAETFEELLAGSLSTAQADTVASHIADCDRCQDLLDRLSDDVDLQKWLPAADAEGSPGDEEAGLGRLLAVPQSLGFSGTANASSGCEVVDDGLAFLGPPRRERDLGTLGTYAVEAELGRGGMGIVLRAYDEELQRTVALKVLRPELAQGQARQRFVQEARAAARVRHDHVVTIFGVANPPDALPYFVMEHLGGPTLADLIRQQQYLEPRAAVAYVVQAAQGLEAAHSAGLVHRDIKPSNIILDSQTGRAKVVDFGLARVIEGNEQLTRDGYLTGTPAYMSPEQVQRPQAVDARADVYGLGATLYEALTRAAPFRGTPARVIHQVLSEDPIAPRRLNEQVPRDLETICLKCLEKEPERRYPSARALADDLSRWQRGEPIQARPSGLLERGLRWCRRKPLAASLAGALILVFVAGTAGVAWKWAEAVRERDDARAQRSRAEVNLRQAREAVDAYLTRISEHPVLKAHEFEPLRRELLQTARDFYERFVAQYPDDPLLRAELGRAHGRLGLITAELESRPKGLAHYQEMQTIFERLHGEHPDDPSYTYELAESFQRQGTAYRIMGACAPAEEAFGRSRALRTELVRNHPEEPAWQYHLARTLQELGSYLMFIVNRYEEAGETFREARTLYLCLRQQQPEDAAYQFGLALVLANLAKLSGLTEQPLRQGEYCQAALELLESLARAHPENPDYAAHQTDMLNELGDSFRSRGQADVAAATWRKALAANEELARRHPTNGYYRHLIADVGYNLANLLYHECRQPDEARRIFATALAIEEQLIVEQPQVAEYAFFLFNIVRDYRNLFRNSDPAQASLKRLTSAIREQEARLPPDRRVESPLLNLYQWRSHLHMQLAHYREALADLDQAWALAEPSARPNFELMRLFAQAQALVQQHAFAQAEDLAARLAGNSTGNGTLLYMSAVIYSQLAGEAIKDRSRAGRCAKRAVELLRQAQAREFFSAPSTRYLLAVERDLDPLRGHAGFRQFLSLDTR